VAARYHHPHTSELELHEVLRALGDPIRLQIAAVLLNSPESSCAPLAARLGIADSTLSHHLRLMREAGLTYTRPAGVQRLTCLRTADLDERFPGLVDWLRRAVAAGHPLEREEATGMLTR
jgi:DNA-binding transcriptional ArsR family regulator